MRSFDIIDVFRQPSKLKANSSKGFSSQFNTKMSEVSQFDTSPRLRKIKDSQMLETSMTLGSMEEERRQDEGEY